MSAWRDSGPSVLVAALSSAFGVALLQTTGLIGAVLTSDPRFGGSDVVAALLDSTAVVFVVIAVYAGAVVTTNTFAVIVAGRVREIALRRLLGATAAAERRAIAREGAGVGAIGALIGLGLGTGVVAAGAAIARSAGALDAVTYDWVQPRVLVPAAAVVVVTWLAATIGSRRVLTVTLLQALGAAEERSEEEAGASRARSVAAVALVVAGAALLVGGILLGETSFDGLLVALAGGVVSFTGIVLGAHLVIPRALRLTGRLLGTSPVARIAAENAVRQPMRSTRSTVGLLVAVTLITTFGVALRTFGDLLEAAAGHDPVYYAGVEQMVGTVTAVFAGLIGFSALIAAVGLVNALSLGVLQRTRELGLLRALGFAAGQLRRMVLAESAQLVLTAVVLGLALGALYGWAGAQSMLGSVRGAPGLALIGVPWPLLGVVALTAAALTVLASLAPARRAVRVAPVQALAAD